MSSLILALIMFGGGMAAALQPSINARLAQKVGLLESSFISFGVGALALLFLILVLGSGGLRNISQGSWWQFTGGFLGALFVTLTILVVPRIGTAAAMAATIAGQLASGLVLDHFGIFGLVHAPLDLKRSSGVGLLLVGAFLVLKR